ncbi:MAG: ABC transporter ATP-binding protein [bacterium]|nr:ABC transporter ATP-binding protein [bacterium]
MQAVSVHDICKQYRLGELRAGDTMLREALVGMFRGRGRGRQAEILHALRGVNFEIERGEVVGLIGRNGAGKSTMLKVLSRITYPTSGHFTVNGRLSAMLEVGTGFHEELTGRENIFMNGSIMGMRKTEIAAKIDQIVEFAGVERFIDTPIKRYSSGMRLRLGFAVAAHLDPDILLVDEVLAVGDAEFQKKCLDSMDELRGGGRTVVFVSHNMAAVENLCRRVIWIDQGKVHMDGPAEEVVRSYMATFASAQSGGADLAAIGSRVGTGQARLSGAEFLDTQGQTLNFIRSGDALTVRVRAQLEEMIPDLHVGLEIRNEMGLLLSISNNWMTGPSLVRVPAGAHAFDLDIEALHLMPGRYYLTLWLKGPDSRNYDLLENCLMMDVETSDWYGTGRGIDPHFGLMFLPARWRADARLTGGA